jgi:hypothetical protein
MPQSRRPVSIRAGPQRIFLVFGVDNIRQLHAFRTTSQKTRVEEMMELLGVKGQSLQVIKDDISGEQTKPRAPVDKDMRIFHNVASLFNTDLMAPESTKKLAERFAVEVVKRLVVVSMSPRSPRLMIALSDTRDTAKRKL